MASEKTPTEGIEWQTETIAEDEISELKKRFVRLDSQKDFEAASRLMQQGNFFDDIRGLIQRCDEVLRDNGWPETSQRIWVHPEHGWHPVKEGEWHGVPWSNHIAALWVQKQTADLSDAWYAARIGFKCRLYLEHIEAGHADRHGVHTMAFEIGSLRTDWQWRRGQKPTILTGKKVRQGAALGGDMRAGKTKPETQKILEEMKRLVSAGHSVSRAADLTFSNGLGASKGANQQLWKRHKPT